MVSSGRWAKLQNDDQNLLYPLYLTAIFYLILKGFKSWGNMMDCFPKYGPVRIIPKKEDLVCIPQIFRVTQKVWAIWTTSLSLGIQ